MQWQGRWMKAVLGASIALVAPVQAQDRAGDDTVKLEAVVVTGSRIKKAVIEGDSPVVTLSADELAASGVTSVGDILQRLSVSSSSLNTKFNSAGNFGFPADGGGVGSGSTTVSLRNLGAKRVLVLVDGLRWVNESSASGVSAAVDLNTIPFSVVDHVEILTDGASALYGSDAIAGVVNIVTKREYDGLGLRLYAADYATGDGTNATANVTFGSSGRSHNFVADISHYDQQLISSSDFGQAREPIPGTGVNFGSSALPTTRSVFFNEPANDEEGGLCPQVDTDDDGVPDRALCNITANGVAEGPDFVQQFPEGFHQFTNADRFNFAPFNLLLTPSERTSLFTQASFELGTGLTAYFKGLVQNRESQNRAAPEPIFIGPGAGTGGLADTVSVDESNPYNPFGITLDAQDNLVFAGRRPLEGGPRIFSQNVDTRYFAAGLAGDFSWLERAFFWDVNAVRASNKASQRVVGTYNIANIARALGPIDECVAPCTALNFFGGPGTITAEMLDYISFVEDDFSRQDLSLVTANISGMALELPSGPLEFAAGYEYRDLKGSYRPDAVVIAGESNGVPSLPTSGGYDVHEVYVELSVPLLADIPGIRNLDLSVASRYSDYSTFGDTTNNKLGLRWAVFDDLTLRGTVAEGFRAPSVGELFGSPARFDASIEDPCSGATDPQTIDNCQAQGVPPGFQQANTQISVRTGGNRALQPETADSLTLGAIYSPAWAEELSWSKRLDFELTYYKHEVDDAIQAVDAQTLLNRCVATLDPAFCSGISRGPTGDINGFDNSLLNLGKVETEGFDFGIDWAGPELALGRLGASLHATKIESYTAISKATGLAEPRRVGVEVADSGIPEWRGTFRLNWSLGDVDASWALRYLSSLVEDCGGAASFPVCDNPAEAKNKLDAVIYNDLRVSWTLPVSRQATLSAGVNNLFDQDPPECLSCSLNGYDASLYDLPGQFGYVEATIRF